MSNHYWNEYMNYHVDENMLVDSLKYHQMTEKKYVGMQKLSDSYIKLCEASTVKVSDVKIQSFDIENIYVQQILSALQESYGKLEIKVSFPVFIFLNTKYMPQAGVYSYDFIKNKLLLIGEVKESIYNIMQEVGESYEVVIPIFLNLIQALFLYKSKGYIRGIEEIGYISGCFMERMKVRNRMEVPNQEFAHEIGINIRKSLLIDVIAL